MSTRIAFVGTAILGLVILTAGALSAAPQQAPPAAVRVPDGWCQGYVRAVGGATIAYPWSYPGHVATLLSRATDGTMSVEWEGEPAPAGSPDDLVTYLWHAGTASGYGAHRFALSLNSVPIATFSSGRTPADREWSVAGEKGARLSFTTTRVGQFGELFGFMWLTAPRSLFGDAAPRFAVVGEAAGSQDYYLGPEARVEEWIRVRPEEAVFAGGQRAIRVSISHVGDAQPAVVRSGDRVLWSGTVGLGHTSVLLPAGRNADATIPITVTLGARPAVTETITALAVRARSIHLLPHSHVDIGYSDPQPEVERKQWKNLRDAVALGRATASFPPEARFKWNVEGLWSVESYLAQASPGERDAFAGAVRAGTIGLQANYTNVLTGLATPEELRRWVDAARRVEAALRVGPIRSAMHSDIPGLSWTAVSALASAGVRYFSSGPNYMPGLPDGGDRIGGTLRALGDRPFWWTSPSGEERVLFWMAGRGYSWFHGLNTGAASDRSRDVILEYVKALADARFPYDMIQVRYTIGGDNGPVDRDLPAFVKRWNEEFASPRLVIDTAEAMFAEFDRRYGADLPVMSGDMTPYWEDGALSSAAEESLARAAARRLQQAEALAVLRGIALPSPDLDAAWRNVLLWHEHTWGAADSVSDPDRADVIAQWEYKRRFATEADRLSRALMSEASAVSAPAAPGFDVVNTLAWPRSGLVLLSPQQSRRGDRVAAGGVALPSQRLADGRLAVWLERVPALASVRLNVVAGPPAVPARPVAVSSDALIDNGRVRVALDADRAAIASLTWTGGDGHEFVVASPGLFRFLYVNGRDPTGAVASTGGTLTVEDGGPLVATVRIDSPAPGTGSTVRRFRVVAGSDLVSAEIGLDKLAVRTKESAHLALPLHVPGGVIRADQGEALVEIERDQLPGACRDFVGLQSAVDVSNARLGVSIVSLDAPLVELGALTDERANARGTRAWREHVAPGTALYAYLLNNYWHTNYKADQAGPLTYRFVVRPHAAFDPVALRRLSDEQDFPLLPIDAAGPDPAVEAPFVLEGDPVSVTSLSTAEDGEALSPRLYNPAGVTAHVVVRTSNPGSEMIVAGPHGAESSSDGRVSIPPRGWRVVRIGPR